MIGLALAVAEAVTRAPTPTVVDGWNWACLSRAELRTLDRPTVLELSASGSSPHCAAWLPLDRHSYERWRRVAAVPEPLSKDWRVVPLPLREWGYRSLRAIGSVRVQADAAGVFRAVGASPARKQSASRGSLVGEPAVTVPLLIFDFARGVVGPMENRFGMFASPRESVALHRSVTSPGLRIETHRSSNGYGGIWIELGPHRQLLDSRWGLDASSGATILIRGRGAPRGVVEISDVQAVLRDAPFRAGLLETAERVPGGRWQWRQPIPPGVDRHRLRSLSINVLGAADDVLELTDVWLLGEHEEPPPPALVAALAPVTTGRRGLWVWHTAEILGQKRLQEELLSTVRTWGFTEIYLQLPYERGHFAGWRGGEKERALALLVARLHGEGVAVQALDGAPFMATASARPLVVAQAKRVAGFNRHWAPEGAFDALHLDIEPYVLPAFGGRRRDALLREYTHTLGAVKTAAEELGLWIDIPFWYDELDDLASAGASRTRTALIDEVAAVVDGLVVMAYRTSADGANGIAAQARIEVLAAMRRNRTAMIGLETTALAPEDAWELYLSETVDPAAGAPLAAVPRQAGSAESLLFTPSATAGDLAWLSQHGGQYRLLAARFESGSPPPAVTFHGGTRAAIEAAAGEALALLYASGAVADGIALHEQRTLPPVSPSEGTASRQERVH